MTMARGLSIAARLVLLFVIGSAVVMAGAGYALYHALRMQLEAQDDAEVRGKTEVVEYVLRDIDSPASLDANLNRLRDIAIGHPHLTISAVYAGRWVLPPDEALRSVAIQAVELTTPLPYFQAQVGARTWWVHRVRHVLARAAPATLDVVVAVETTHTSELLRRHAVVALIVGLVGTFANALLAWFVARRGLSPLAQLASRAGQVTAQRLGARLHLKDAPHEVHGLAVSMNKMLERLEESFRTLEQFSADIAHELRTPLNNLLLQTQVTLARPRSSDEYQEALHSNLVEIERLQHMTSEMLFLARADRGMIELSEDDIDVRAEARNVAEYFEAAAAEKGQSISIAGEAHRKGDRLLLRRALTNLLSNAVRYSPDDAAIQVRIASDKAGVSVAVTNPGSEIPAPELKRLFSRFARREESRTRAREGVGLGLAIVESIMKTQGGSVEGGSRDGQIEFTLHFPARKEAAGGSAAHIRRDGNRV